MTMTGSAPITVWHFDDRLKVPDTSELHGVTAVSVTEAWAVGSVAILEGTRRQALVGRWNSDFGRVPSAPVDPALDVHLTAVDWAGDTVWAVGYVSDTVKSTRARIERYDRQSAGSAGEAVPGPLTDGDSALYGVAMVSDKDGWAVGGSGPGKNGLTRTLITHWDGTGWTAVPSPSPGTQYNQLNAVAARSADDVWAVGHCVDVASGGRTEALVVHWDGSGWTRVPVPRTPGGGDQLLGVAVIGKDTVWAVGTSTRVVQNPAGLHTALALHWDGSVWQAIRPGGPVTQFSAVAAKSETEVWFAGYAEATPGAETAHIERWDGVRISPDRPMTNDAPASALSGITVGAGHIAAVGWRTTTGGQTPQAAALVPAG
ncbi:hypothetical protein [Actinocrispum sp. NPDC049592]|uniref:hypothetical protein n=1 Tax=Actinocrispum sp. NPDC049592 TaxID=3154835 RepID=UPI0034246258